MTSPDSVSSLAAVGDGGPRDESYRQFFEQSVVGLYRTTVDGAYSLVNEALARLYGFATAEELINSLRDISAQLYVDPSRRNDFARALSAGDEVYDFDAEVYRRDGSIIWIREHARCVRDADGNIRHYEGTVTDITLQKQAEQEVRLLLVAFNSLAEGVLIIDRDLKVCWVNAAFSAITGFEAEELLGESLALPVFSDEAEGIVERIWSRIQSGVQWRGEQWLRRKNGDGFLAWLSVSAAKDGSYPVERFVLVCTDITQRKQIEERLKFHANYDALTNLPNRVMLQSRLEQEIERAAAAKTLVAIYYLDLDRFKPVNDRMGHQAGDQLLQLAAKRMRNSLRLSDTVGRLGGDEFLVIAADIADRGAAAYIAEKIRYAFSEPFNIQGTEVYCSASIGIAMYPEDGTNVDTLVVNADTAMYNSKKIEPNQYRFFADQMRKQELSGHDLEGDLRRALLREEFLLYYQPKLDLETGQIISAEALIRWQHPALGMVQPSAFIPLAEKIGLIRAIGVWTLRMACFQMQAWRQSGSTIAFVAVNLSPLQFNDDKLVKLVASVLEETGLEPGGLELELTEGAIISDVERAVATMAALKALGVRVAIDDFGTGYSSLAYLKRFPIDTLKIDRSFVTDLEHDPTDQAIVATILELGKNLGLSVVAEGVENENQLAYLHKRDCHVAQGYYIGRPMEGSAVEALAKQSETAQRR